MDEATATTARVMAQLDRVPSNNSSAGAGPCENAWEDGNEDTINDVESLKQGIIKTSKNKTKVPYTIFLVGETGVGKSSVFELIANVLAGNDIGHYDLDILDRANEQGGSNNQSQTNSARFYTLTSKNGIVVRILDTPGLADTRGIEQDELHKKSIATQIEKHIDTVTAVLVLANGTVPRVTVGTNYALSTLPAIFPKPLASNIGFMFTNVLSPLHWNFSTDTIPHVLKGAPQFLLSNPIALYKKYLKLEGDSTMKKRLHREVLAAEQKALEMLVELFDWLDGLEPQPKAEVVPLCGESQDPRVLMGRVGAQHAKNSALVLCSRCAHPYLFHVHESRLPIQRGLSHVMDNSMDELPRFAKDYSGPWSSGSLSASLKKATRLLEQNHKYMAENGVGQEQLENMQCGLERMKRKLALLRMTKEKARGGVWKVKRISIRE